VRADAGLEVVADQSDLERVVDRLERVFGHLELFVGTDGALSGERWVLGGAADHVKPVERSFGRDLLGLAMIRTESSAISSSECLAILYLPTNLPAICPRLRCAGSALLVDHR
jgi:hypothetical protein